MIPSTPDARLVGYARVSTGGQDLDLPLDALELPAHARRHRPAPPALRSTKRPPTPLTLEREFTLLLKGRNSRRRTTIPEREFSTADSAQSCDASLHLA